MTCTRKPMQVIFRPTRVGGSVVSNLVRLMLFEGLDKSTDIKITWDDEAVPAVYCPVADFFGYAFGSHQCKAFFLVLWIIRLIVISQCLLTSPQGLSLFRRNPDGSSSKPVNIKAEIWYTQDKRMPDSEGRFYACWEKKVKLQRGVPHTIADIRGKGHYVGTLLQAQGLNAGMTIFFEGDDSTSIDNIPRLHGTGSEDYFNGGWYAMMDRWDDKMSLPLHGSLGYSLPFCRTGGYRLYLSDKLSFEKSFWHSIEHGPAGNNIPADYTSLGLYYCDSSPEIITIPATELSKVFIPDTLVYLSSADESDPVWQNEY